MNHKIKISDSFSFLLKNMHTFFKENVTTPAKKSPYIKLENDQTRECLFCTYAQIGTCQGVSSREHGVKGPYLSLGSTHKSVPTNVCENGNSREGIYSCGKGHYACEA